MVVDLRANSGVARGPRRRFALTALVLGVVAVHGCVTQSVVGRMADLDAERDMPARMEVTYVRELAPTAPPPTALAAAPTVEAPAPVHRATRPRLKPARPASAPEAKPASTPPVVAALSDPTPPAAATASEPASSAASDVVEAKAESARASAPAEEAAAAASSPSGSSAGAARAASTPAAGAASKFEWPTSTRVSYVLNGYYRGDVKGSAQVEWIRDGTHYQVHVDLVVGPSVAPIVTRRATSDGEITAEGLTPSRYDEDTKVLMGGRTRRTVTFEPDAVVLSTGERRDRIPGLQDGASQFVQLSYVFSTRPEMLTVGGSVDMALALPRKVDVWTYDVVGEEPVSSPFGPLDGIHLKPRRVDQHAGSISAEMWFAPQLRYLPVRIRFEQDDQTYLDLTISRPPEIAN